MGCAECDDSVFSEHCKLKAYCLEGMGIAMVNCDPKKRGNKNKRRSWMATFTLLRGDDSSSLFSVAGSELKGDQIQVHKSNLCLERVRSRGIVLKQCDASVLEQRFFGFRAGGQKMELLIPRKYKRKGVEYVKCLTQHHHPRQGERIYAEDCSKARRSDTNLWSTY